MGAGVGGGGLVPDDCGLPVMPVRHRKTVVAGRYVALTYGASICRSVFELTACCLSFVKP